MRRLIAASAIVVVLGSLGSLGSQGSQGSTGSPGSQLDVYFVDVEGGQATLFVSPSGQTLLVDAGFPGDRDTERILAAAAVAGVKQIDYFVNTHYHTDHIGGVPTLAPKLPIRTFIDHGTSVEPPGTPGVSRGTLAAFDAYAATRGRGQYVVAKPGDSVPIAGLAVTVVSAATKTITAPLAGAGSINPLCAAFEPKDETKDIQLGNENAQSVGMVISYGRFRMLDLGDLTWNHERDLACPRNLIGPVDLYLTTHHGQNISSLPALVGAVAPRVTIMNNGGRKGGAVETFQTLHALPVPPDLWQLHFAVAAGVEHNSSEPFIANPDDTTAHFIKLTARQDGSFTVTNSRNGFTKTYPAR